MALDLTLTKEDENKIKHSDYYEMIKAVIEAKERNTALEIGGTYLLAYTNSKGELNIDDSEKFIVVKNEDGFVFAKKIISGGSLGKTMYSLTIDYRDAHLVPDPSYIDAVLLEDEASYDPTAEGKDIAKKKAKANRLNKAKKLFFASEEEATAAILSWKVGDVFWSSNYLYCDEIIEHTITAIETKTQQHHWSGVSTNWIEITSTASGSDKTWRNGPTTQRVDDFTNKYFHYFKEKPTKYEDLL